VDAPGDRGARDHATRRLDDAHLLGVDQHDLAVAVPVDVASDVTSLRLPGSGSGSGGSGARGTCAGAADGAGGGGSGGGSILETSSLGAGSVVEDGAGFSF
jgi:hypothetical protein